MSMMALQDIHWTAPYFAIEGGHIKVFEYFLKYHEGKAIDINHKDTVSLNIPCPEIASICDGVILYRKITP